MYYIQMYNINSTKNFEIAFLCKTRKKKKCVPNTAKNEKLKLKLTAKILSECF